MAYGLDQFCGDLTRILKAEGTSGLTAIAGKLQQLLVDPAFVAATFSDDTLPGKRELFHDHETDAHVLAHVHAAGGHGTPHSHGTSWAIYGNARGVTEMTEWQRLNPESDEHAELAVRDKYVLGLGQARAYGPHVMHSTAHPEKAWVIRITGTDLSTVPRFRFRPGRDRIAEDAGGRGR